MSFDLLQRQLVSLNRTAGSTQAPTKTKNESEHKPNKPTKKISKKTSKAQEKKKNKTKKKNTKKKKSSKKQDIDYNYIEDVRKGIYEEQEARYVANRKFIENEKKISDRYKPVLNRSLKVLQKNKHTIIAPAKATSPSFNDKGEFAKASRYKKYPKTLQTT